VILFRSGENVIIFPFITIQHFVGFAKKYSLVGLTVCIALLVELIISSTWQLLSEKTIQRQVKHFTELLVWFVVCGLFHKLINKINTYKKY
jgi:hypothetical protein